MKTQKTNISLENEGNQYGAYEFPFFLMIYLEIKLTNKLLPAKGNIE